MAKLTAIKIKYSDNNYSDQIPIGVLANNVQYDNSHSLIDVLGNVNLLSKGDIQTQIDNIYTMAADLLTVSVDNVQYDNSHSLTDILGNIDFSSKGDIQTQIDNLSSSMSNIPITISEDMLDQDIVQNYKNSNLTIEPGSITNLQLADECKKDYITPQMFGANADGITDDTNAIQQAFNALPSSSAVNASAIKTIFFPKGTYKITGTIEVPPLNDAVIKAQEATIVYTGTDYAIHFQRLRNSNIYLGTVRADNGGCLLLTSIKNGNINDCTSNVYQDAWWNYNNFYFRLLQAKNYVKPEDPNDQPIGYACVKVVQQAPAPPTSWTGGFPQEWTSNERNNFLENDKYKERARTWMSEIRWHNGRLARGKYGFHITRSSPQDNMSHWNFHEVVIEGVYVGFYFDSAPDEKTIGSFLFDGCRHEAGELGKGLLIHTIGKVTKMNWICQTALVYPHYNNKIKIEAAENHPDLIANDWIVYNSIYDSFKIINGKIVRIDKFYSLDGGIRLLPGTDLDLILTPGNYYANKNTDVAGKEYESESKPGNDPMYHVPTRMLFTLKVEDRSGESSHGASKYKYFRQTLIDYNNNEYRRSASTQPYQQDELPSNYIQWKYTAWERVFTSKQITNLDGKWVDITDLMIGQGANQKPVIEYNSVDTYTDNGVSTPVPYVDTSTKLRVLYNEALGMVNINGDLTVNLNTDYVAYNKLYQNGVNLRPQGEGSYAIGKIHSNYAPSAYYTPCSVYHNLGAARESSSSNSPYDPVPITYLYEYNLSATIKSRSQLVIRTNKAFTGSITISCTYVVRSKVGNQNLDYSLLDPIVGNVSIIGENTPHPATPIDTSLDYRKKATDTGHIRYFLTQEEQEQVVT